MFLVVSIYLYGLFKGPSTITSCTYLDGYLSLSTWGELPRKGGYYAPSPTRDLLDIKGGGALVLDHEVVHNIYALKHGIEFIPGVRKHHGG